MEGTGERKDDVSMEIKITPTLHSDTHIHMDIHIDTHSGGDADTVTCWPFTRALPQPGRRHARPKMSGLKSESWQVWLGG